MLFSPDLEDPLRAINKYNHDDIEKAVPSSSDWGETHYGEGAMPTGRNGGGSGGIYGVVKHMTDEPYSYDEYRYESLLTFSTDSLVASFRKNMDHFVLYFCKIASAIESLHF